MVTNINGLTPAQSGASRSRDKPVATSDAPVTRPDSARASSDSVSLSTEALQLQDIESGIRNFPEVNQERVAQLRETLREGNYSVDPARLAAKIVQFELDI